MSTISVIVYSSIGRSRYTMTSFDFGIAAEVKVATSSTADAGEAGVASVSKLERSEVWDGIGKVS
jgi:hypothetical protein